MPETINSTDNDKDYFNNNFNRRFLFVDNISNHKKLRPEIELCVVQTDFNKADLKSLKKLKGLSKNTVFWISSNNLSKENILLANKIGIKTVISDKFDRKIISEFFEQKDGLYIKKSAALDYDYSCISNSKVMIVDDNSMNIELLEEILSKFEIKISSFIKPKEAYQAILKEKFDLFLFDIMMPDMSGFELAKKIKEVPLNQNTPVIFISALSDTHNKIKGYNLGSYAYIEKPFDMNLIKTQIFNLLKTQKAREIVASNKEDFLATVAHDLKTPIRAGINALNLLLNEEFGELEESQQEIVEDLLNSTKFMRDMVDNILCRNKIESDKITLSKQVYPLKDLVEHCIELTKYILEEKEQEIDFECEVYNTLLPMDFLEMKRAINNLIANASEYSPAGSNILVKIFETESKMGFSIQDFGGGIEIEHQDDVFSQYMSMAKKHKTVGSGLGLYITKKIIEAHNGEIKLESKIGCGTKMTILLPTYNKI